MYEEVEIEEGALGKMQAGVARKWQHMLDMSAPHTAARWGVSALVMLTYALRVYLINGAAAAPALSTSNAFRGRSHRRHPHPPPSRLTTTTVPTSATAAVAAAAAAVTAAAVTATHCRRRRPHQPCGGEGRGAPRCLGSYPPRPCIPAHPLRPAPPRAPSPRPPARRVGGAGYFLTHGLGTTYFIPHAK